MIPHNRLTYGRCEEEAVAAVVRSGQWAMGERVANLERTLAELVGVSDAVVTGTGLAALRIALLGVGVNAGDRVGVPAYSCVALPNAILSCGAVPVPLDVRPGSWNVDPEEAISAASTGGLSAIIAVHTFGYPAPMLELKAVGVPVVEDCAHGLGIEVAGRRLGAQGDVAVLSMYATKLIGSGEGGCVLSSAPEITEYARGQRDYTDKGPSADRLNDKMTDILAAVAQCQVERLPEIVRIRRDLAERYDRLLGESPLCRKRLQRPSLEPARVWYRYVVELDRPVDSALLTEALRRGVAVDRPVEPWIADLSAFPVAERAYERLLSLPLYPTLAHNEQEDAVRRIEQALEAI